MRNFLHFDLIMLKIDPSKCVMSFKINKNSNSISVGAEALMYYRYYAGLKNGADVLCGSVKRDKVRRLYEQVFC